MSLGTNHYNRKNWESADFPILCQVTILLLLLLLLLLLHFTPPFAPETYNLESNRSNPPIQLVAAALPQLPCITGRPCLPQEKITFNSLTNSVGPRRFLHCGLLSKTKSEKELVRSSSCSSCSSCFSSCCSFCSSCSSGSLCSSCPSSSSCSW